MLQVRYTLTVFPRWSVEKLAEKIHREGYDAKVKDPSPTVPTLTVITYVDQDFYLYAHALLLEKVIVAYSVEVLI